MPEQESTAPPEDSWLDMFIEETKDLTAPMLYKEIGAVAAVAGILERRVWIVANGMRLFPNLYVILVAGPGVGKTVTSSFVQKIWQQIKGFHFAPTNTSGPALMDALYEAKRQLIRIGETPPVVEYNAMSVLSNELGQFLQVWDGGFLSSLTDIWDGHGYVERKRGNALKIDMPAPCLNLLTGTTPSWLMNTMPAGAWEQGFSSRSLFVYSGERVLTSLFEGREVDLDRVKALAAKIEVLAEDYGEYAFTEEAAHAIDRWHLAGGPPIPEHTKLAHYLPRRSAHLLKLCVCVAAASLRRDFTITLDDYTYALDLLLRIEAAMPDIFHAMVAGGDSAAIEETWQFVYTIYMKENKPVREHRLVSFLSNRVPSHNIQRVMDIMVRARMLQRDLVGMETAYTPLAKKNF